MAVDAAFLSDPAVVALFAALPGARGVGGCVRDALAGQPTADIDLATPMPPDAVLRALEAAGIKAVPTGLDHGTMTAVLDGRGFEVTTLRRDVVTDGRHAEVAWTDDWQVDAARRDFTINAMSMTPDGALFDYFGGVADLRAGRVRFVGDAAMRVAEDHLRILRFFRFQARYGTGDPDPEALAAVAAGAKLIARLSVERVWSELKRILAASDPAGSVALMDRLGVLAFVLPEGADVAALARLCATAAPADPILRTAALLAGDPAAFAARLKLSQKEGEMLTLLLEPSPPGRGQGEGSPLYSETADIPSSLTPGLSQRERERAGQQLTPTASDSTLRRALAAHPAAILIARTWLTGDATPDWDALRARLAATPRPFFPLEGRDVLALGIPPGPAVGILLRAVEAWWVDGGCVADAAACRAELARLARG